jgi:hypothetical protein
VVAEAIHPDGVPANDLPAQRAVFAPGADPDMIAEVAARLRKDAGLPSKPTGVVANGDSPAKSAVKRAKSKVTAR